MLNSKKRWSICPIFCALMMVAQGCLAQKVTLVNSTERRWSGGIAGHSGVNYTFSIRFEGYKQEPEPDTLWIGDQPIKVLLEKTNPNLSPNTQVSRSKKFVQFDITAGTSHDDYADRVRYPGQRELDEKPRPPISYTGTALLSYGVYGKRKYYVVSRIMNVYPPVNYP